MFLKFAEHCERYTRTETILDIPQTTFLTGPQKPWFVIASKLACVRPRLGFPQSMNRTPWIEREFHFDLPMGVFPCIVERLRGTPARLEELIQSYPAWILAVRVNSRWSIQEHIGHLYDLDELHECRLDDFKARLGMLRPADMTNRKTYEANHNAKPIEELLTSLRSTRKHFVGQLEDLDEEMLSRSAIHPRLQKPMRVIDMAFFVAEHDDHHLATITELSRMLNLKP